MRSPKIEAFAASASRWIGLVSVETAAYISMSASLMVLPRLAVWPTWRSSKKVPCGIATVPPCVCGLSGRRRQANQPRGTARDRPRRVDRFTSDRACACDAGRTREETHMSARLEDLLPEFRTKVEAALASLTAEGLVFRPYFTLRDPVTQAR